MLLAVASYTEPVGHAPTAHGAGVVVVDLDLRTGASRTVFAGGGIRNCAFVCAHPTLPVIYVASEVYDGPGVVTSLAFTPDFTTVVASTDLPTGGSVVSHISLYDDRTLLLTNYAEDALVEEFGPASVASFSIGADGHLVERLSLVALNGSGPDSERQLVAHAHCALRHPVNGFVYVADLGSDAIVQLRVDDGVLAPVASTPVPAGSGPRHLAFSPAGERLFAVYELSSQLGVFDVAADGSLTPVASVSLLPEWATMHSSGADLAVAHGGERVYASNRGHDSVVTIERGADGAWAAVAWTSTGGVPRSLALTRDERHLIAGNQQSDSLSVFSVAHNGALEPQTTLPCATPTLVRVLRGDATS